jgi:antitoxin component of MazEF toxin-antitoxin module
MGCPVSGHFEIARGLARAGRATYRKRAMQKHLSRIGNSLGLLIDRPILRMLGITQETPLRISHDGKRILIEPIRGAPPRPAPVPAALVEAMPDPYQQLEGIDAEQTARELYNLWGMENEHVEALHHRCKDMLRYEAWAGSFDIGTRDDDDRQTVQRLAACLDERRAGKAWPEAIEAALASFPR